MEWKVEVKITNCTEIFQPELGEGVIGYIILEISDDKIKELGLDGAYQIVLDDARSFVDDLIDVSITPLGLVYT